MRKALTAIAVGGVLLGFDLGAAPHRQWTARGMVAGIEIYQRTLSPLLGESGVRCRFEPTCSHYAVAALRRHGAMVGVGKAAWRIARCGPWTPAGTVDPI